MQLVGSCPCVPGHPPTAPAQHKQPLSQDLQEAQSFRAWKPNEEHSRWRASSRVEEAAQPRAAHSLLGWIRARLQYGRTPALLSGPIWQSSWSEAALPWPSLALTCLAARLPAMEGAGSLSLGDATVAFLASALLLPCLCTRGPWGWLRGRWVAHCQWLQQGELCQREGKGKCRSPPAVA